MQTMDAILAPLMPDVFGWLGQLAFRLAD